jgi:hypothetical protein
MYLHHSDRKSFCPQITQIYTEEVCRNGGIRSAEL